MIQSARLRLCGGQGEAGEEVFSLDWMSEWGGGRVWVVRRRGRYHAHSSEEIEPAGPYPSLEEALARGAGVFGPADVEITCSAMPAGQLVAHLDCHDPGRVIRINDELWRMDAGGAVRLGTAEVSVS